MNEQHYRCLSTRILMTKPTPFPLTLVLGVSQVVPIIVSLRSIFSLFSPNEDSFASAQLRKFLLRHTCTTLLLEDEFVEHNMSVWRSALPIAREALIKLL